MRLYMYFAVDNGQWKVTEIRTYNGQPSGDWLFYNGFTGGSLGSAYTGSMDINNTSGSGNGTIHFSDLHLLPNFVTQDYAIQVTSPNGGEHFTQGQNTDIHWNFKNPGRTDTQTFNTSIYVEKNDGTKVLTLVDNQSITKFNDNVFHWNIANVPNGDYKIFVYLNTPFSTANGTQNLNDTSGTFSIDGEPTPTQQPTATPIPTTVLNNTNQTNDSQAQPIYQSTPTTTNTQVNIPTTTPTSIWQSQGKNTEKKKDNKKKENHTTKKVDSKAKKQSANQNNFFTQIIAWFHSHFHLFS